jgi:intracellular sulfur oxidation DsrE/DsrF family protein
MSFRSSLRLLAMLPALALAFSAGAADGSHLKDFPKKHKVVYQLIDPGPDKARLVLRNIQQHVEGVGGWQHFEALELVVHGQALKSFVKDEIDPGVKRTLEMLQTQGMQFGACGNTMRNFSITLEQLPEGSKLLPQGGVVRLMELQEAGYVYLRP